MTAAQRWEAIRSHADKLAAEYAGKDDVYWMFACSARVQAEDAIGCLEFEAAEARLVAMLRGGIRMVTR